MRKSFPKLLDAIINISDTCYYSIVFLVTLVAANKVQNSTANVNTNYYAIRESIRPETMYVAPTETKSFAIITKPKPLIKRKEIPNREILIEPDKILPVPPKVEEHKIKIKKHVDTINDNS